MRARLVIPGCVFACGVGASLARATPATSSDEVRAIASRVMADAQTRANLSSNAVTVEHEGTSFVLRTDDGTFSLGMMGEFQFRYTASYRNGPDPDFDEGFEVRRLRLHAIGRVLGIDYRIQTGFKRDSGVAILEFAYVRYRPKERGGWALQWGQFKEPLLREELVPARFQLCVDRSLVNEVFTQGFTEGVQLEVEHGAWRGLVMFSDGMNAARTDYTSVQVEPLDGEGEADWAVTTRVEWMPVGSGWALFKEFTGPPGTPLGVMVGAAAHAEGGESRVSDDYAAVEVTADLSIKGDGWNAFAYGVWRRLRTDEAGPFDDWGLVVQGGAFVPGTDWELFARYDLYIPDPDGPESSVFPTLTVGANWYIHGQAAKLSVDVQWFVNDSTETDFRTLRRAAGIGFLGSTEPNEVALRAQFQLLF